MILKVGMEKGGSDYLKILFKLLLRCARCAGKAKV